MLGFTLVLSCLAARPAGPGSSCPSVLACTGIAVPTVGQGLCFFPLKPHSSRLSPHACALQGRGDLRGHVVGSGSLRQEEVPSSPAWRHPSHHREPGRSPACVCPGPGWLLPGISRVSSLFRCSPGLTARQLAAEFGGHLTTIPWLS